MAALGEHWHWELSLTDTDISIVSDPNSEEKTVSFGLEKLRHMTVDQLEVILRHEWGHVVLKHHEWDEQFKASRDQSESPEVWKLVANVAADMEVNSTLAPLLEAAGLADIAFIPGHGPYAYFPPGLKAEDYANMIITSPEIMAKMR